MRALFLVVLALGAGSSASVEDRPAAGFPITIHIPEELCVRTRNEVKCTLTVDGGATSVNGKTGWQADYMPVAYDAVIKKWKFRKDVGTLTATESKREWTILAQGTTEEESLALLWTVHSSGGRKGKRAGEKFNEHATTYAARVFSMVEDVEARTLLVASARQFGALRIDLAEYRDRPYAAIDLGRDPGGWHYNTLQLSEVQRVATEIKRRVLPTVQAFGVALKRSVPLEGFKISLQVGSRNFLNGFEAVVYDQVELYVPSGLAAAFANDDATSQELVDGSINLVDGNRVAIDLSMAKAD